MLEKRLDNLKKILVENISRSKEYSNDSATNMSEIYQLIELIYDAKGTAIDYYFWDVNPNLEKVVAKTRKQLIGKRAKDLFGVVEDYWLEIFDEVIKTREPQKTTKYNQALDKTFSIYAWHTKGQKVAVIINEITDHKLHEKEIIRCNELLDALNIQELRFQYKKNQNFNETVLENIPADIALFDTNHKYLFINTKGISDGELRKWLIGKSDFDYCDLKGIDKSAATVRRDYFNKAVENKEGIEWIDTYNKEDGNVYVMRKFHPVFIDNVLQYVIGYGIDVTLLKKTQNELNTLNISLQDRTIALSKANEELKQSSKELKGLNDTKNKLLSIIGHDLRSPFIGILGLSELLIDNIEEYEIEESKQFLGSINSSAKSTLTLLDNLLGWANFQTGQINFNPEDLNFSSIMQEILDIYTLSLKVKNISLKYAQSDDLEVYADLNMFKTVLRNLISNSIKFTNSKGNVEVNALQKKNCIEITVSDDGVGMNKKTMIKLFKLHNKATKLGTDKESGSGLGLLLCKEFVEKHGGTIWAKSEIGKGSIFKFTLPLSS